MKFLALLSSLALLGACASNDSTPPEADQAPADHLLHRTETQEGDATRTRIVGRAVPLAGQPTVDWIGLPMSGDADVSIDIRVPRDLHGASGTIELACPSGCRLGDDKAMIHTTASTGDLYVGHIDFERVDIRVTIANGKATITRWDVASNDVTLRIDGAIELGRTLADSRVTGCLQFAGTPQLAARDPKTLALITTTGATLGSHGLFNIELAGTFGQLQRLARVCDGSAPPGASSTVAATPVGAPRTGSAVAAKIAKAVTPRSATELDVDVAELKPLLADLVSLASGARLVPTVRDGKPIGLKVYAIRPGSLAERLGFHNGDLIVKVAGHSVLSANKALDVYQALGEVKVGQAVSVMIERGGQPLTITLHGR